MELRFCPQCDRVFGQALSCPECGGPLVVASPDILVGRSFGKYRLEAILGAGGMGVVYRAEHEALQRTVALKLILPDVDDEEYRQRFLREARLAASIRHPNVVEIFDFDVADIGLPFSVMEYLEGRTLRQLLEERPSLEPDTALRILRQMAAGLAAAHRQNVVHRDLKPENVFLAHTGDGQEQVKLLDFGIAKPIGTARQETLTRTGFVVGTIAYMAPEQLLEEPISPATDQYALALVAAEMLGGRAVREGSSAATIIRTATAGPASVPELEARYPASARVISRATRPKPGERFPDVGAFVDALGEALAKDGESSAATRILPGRRKITGLAGPRKRRRLPAVAGASALAVLLVTAAVLMMRYGREAPRGPALLELVRQVPVPVDATRIVTTSGDTLALSGLNGIDLVALDVQRPPGRIALDPGDLLLGTEDGEAVVRDGDRIAVLGVGRSERIELARGVPVSGPLFSSPDSRWFATVEGHRLTVWQRNGTAVSRLGSLDTGFEPETVAVGNHLLAAAGQRTLAVWSLPARTLVRRTVIEETGVTALAVDGISDLVAVGGWFDTVMLLDPSSGSIRRIPRRHGATREVALRFVHLARGTTLAVGERDGVSLWDPGGTLVARWDRPGATIEDLLPGLGGLLALDTASHTVFVLSLGGIAPERTIPFGGNEAWALVADPGSGRVLAGDSTGTLFAIPVTGGHVRTFRVHTQGITALVTDGHHLASASDDRTIAIWRLPSLDVEWRTRAHGFLVNSLRLDPGGKALWSASSDGRVKRWSWPDLDELETIDVGSLLGRPISLHACWIGRSGHRLLAGTWNRILVRLERTADGLWKAHAMAFSSQAGYQLAGLDAVDAVAVLGVGHPAILALEDLQHDTLLPLRWTGGPVYCLAVLDGGQRLLAFSRGEVLDYRIRRASDGTLHYRLAVVRHAGADQPAAAALLPDGRVALATTGGTLEILDTAQITGSWLCDLPAGQ